MMPLDQLVEEVLEEESVMANRHESDLSALNHAVGQVWRDMPPTIKSYLISEAKSLLRQLGRDPKGVLWRIVGLAGLLVFRRRLPPKSAVTTATRQVLHRRTYKRLGRINQQMKPQRRPPQPRPMTKTRWQRGRRGNRFESWNEMY